MWLKAERQSVFLPPHFSALAAFQGKVMSRLSPSTVWSRASVHPALLLLFFPHFHPMPPFLFSGSSPECFYTTCCVPRTYNVGRLFGRRDHSLNCHKMFFLLPWITGNLIMRITTDVTDLGGVDVTRMHTAMSSV